MRANVKRVLITILLLAILNSSLFSQDKFIHGKIIDDLEMLALPGVSIIIKDSLIIGETDMDGIFQISVPSNIKKISFCYLGMEITSIELSEECDVIELIMLSSCTDDFMTFEKVNKNIRKRTKLLPKLYKKAFKKGIFMSKKPCFSQKIVIQNIIR